MSETVEKEYNVPELRFPGFDEEWQEATIGDRLSKVIDYRGKAPPKTGSGVPLITARNVRLGYIDFTADEYIDESLYESWMNRGRPNPDDVLFTTEAPLGNVCLYPQKGEYALGQRIITLQANLEHLFSKFLYQYLLSPMGQKKVDVRGTGSTAKGIKSKVFVKIPFSAPPVPEQQKIASFLTSVDVKIAQLQKKKALLEAYKKGCMQKLFPREGETKPRLRFPEFLDAGDWDEKKLKNLGTLVSGLTYRPSDVGNEGLLVLRSSNIQNGMIDLEDKVFVSSDVKGANLSQPNDILICVRNGSKPLIGKNALIPEALPLCTHGAFMTVFRSAASKFTFQLFQTDAYRSQVVADLGATINSINGGNFLNFRFHVPEPPEQQKIADFLSAIDDKITLTTDQHTYAKTFKKGLLQKMFV